MEYVFKRIHREFVLRFVVICCFSKLHSHVKWCGHDTAKTIMSTCSLAKSSYQWVRTVQYDFMIYLVNIRMI